MPERTATFDRTGREIAAPVPTVELPLPIHAQERSTAIVPLADGRVRLFVDGVCVGVAATAELLAPACRLLGGAAA